jgi:arylsulfatase A-like enzyme
MPAILADNGYDTNLFGFQHEHWDPYRLGYSNVYKVRNNHCESVAPVFCKWLDKHESSRPFLASIGFSEVHRMGLNPSHFKKEGYLPVAPSEVEVRPYLPDIKETREDLADFYGAIRYMDKWVGEILKAVDRSGITNNTLVIFTTDHGASFYHSKATLYEGGTKVALLMSWKGKLPSHNVITGLTSHVDILPSVLNILDIPVPAYMEGRSFHEELCGDGSTGRQFAFSEENYNNHFSPGRAVRSDRFRYIKYGLRICLFDFLIPEIELSTSNFRKNPDVFNFYTTNRCEEELYDIENDPGERVNLIDKPEFEGILDSMRASLSAHLKETNDPFAEFKCGIKMPEKTYSSIRAQKRK